MRMQSRRRRRAYLDQVLEGRASGPDPLVDLMRQLQAPPRRREVRGLRPASSAFAWAPSTRPYLPPHHRTGLTSMGAHLWHPKALAGGLTLVAVTAIAYATSGAATTHHSPTTVTSADIAAKISAASASAAASASSAANPHPSSSSAGKVAVAPSATSSNSPVPTPSSITIPPSNSPEFLPSLCNAWIASTEAAAANNPLFAYLINLEGGVDAVQLFCTTLLNSATPPATSGATPKSSEPAPGLPPLHLP
jgi:hypothetical protein